MSVPHPQGNRFAVSPALVDQAVATQNADDLTGANSALFSHPSAAHRLERARVAPVSPSDRELLSRLSYLRSNDPDRRPQPRRPGGYSSEKLRDMAIADGSGHDLLTRESAFECYVKALADNGTASHCVQVFGREHYREPFEGLPVPEGDPIAVMTWPVPLFWSVRRVILSLLHGDFNECWWCGRIVGEISVSPGCNALLPVHCGGITRVMPTCWGCLSAFSDDIGARNLTVISVSEAVDHREFAYPADHRTTWRPRDDDSLDWFWESRR